MNDNKSPLISVIVPIYNVEKYLNRCIYSILNQSYKNLEIILVDDGSKDSSLNICNKYGRIDNRVKVIHKENNGAASARNTGINISNGDYIAFVDSDDYIEKDMYKNMVSKALEFNCDVVMCDCYKKYKSKKEIFTHDIRKGFYNKTQLYDEYFDKLLMLNSINYPPTISNVVCMIRKKIIDENSIRYVEGIKFSEDMLFGSEFMYYANSFYYMKGEAYYNYIYNPESVTNTYCEKKWNIFLELFREIQKFFLDKLDYNFSKQVDYSLLFFIYNAIGDIYNSNKSIMDKYNSILDILNNKQVREMFKNINISDLNISKKQKLITYIYKNKIGILPLIIYMRKNRLIVGS